MKTQYKIPYSINVKLEDTEIPIPDFLGGKDHIFKMRTIAVMIGGLLGWVMLTKNLSWTWGSWFGGTLWTLGYIGLIYFSLRELDVPGLLGFNALQNFIDLIITHTTIGDTVRTDKDYTSVAKFVGMAEPTDRGYIHFANGDYGILYEIIGTASNNTFAIDRQNAITDYENFLRTLPYKTTISFVTMAGSQNVSNQIKYLMNVYENEKDTYLKSLYAQQLAELIDTVAESFISLHPYMLIRSHELQDLVNADKSIRVFITQTGYAISSIKRPTAKEETEFFRSFYLGISENDVDQVENRFKEQTHSAKSELSTSGSRIVKRKPGKPKIVRRKVSKKK